MTQNILRILWQQQFNNVPNFNAVIWQIANDVRGSVDGWDFKQYVLGTLFYRFISEKLC